MTRHIHETEYNMESELTQRHNDQEPPDRPGVATRHSHTHLHRYYGSCDRLHRLLHHRREQERRKKERCCYRLGLVADDGIVEEEEGREGELHS